MQRTSSCLAVVLAFSAILAVSPVSAQVDSFGDLTWTFVNPGSASGTLSDGEMQVIGPDGGGICSNGTAAYYEAVAPFAGTVRVTLDWTSLDLFHYDWPVYVLDGDMPIKVITPGGSLSWFPPGVVEVSFAVEEGQVFGLGAGSADCFEGPGIATWTHFSLLPATWIDVGGALDPRLEYEVVEEALGVKFGLSLAVVGDVDGDGVSEFVVSASQGLQGGPVTLYRGSDGSKHWTSNSESLGTTFAAPGDVNGDDAPDVAVGTYGDSRVDMLSGVDGSVLWAWEWRGSELDYYAGSLARHADIDGDGVPDIAVGTNTTPSHSVLILSGADGSLLREIVPSPGDDRFGGALGDAGDLDGDGHSDLAVRASASPPIVRVYSGADAAILLEIDAADGLPAVGLNPFNAATLLGLDDIDGDGIRDLALGAPLDNQFFNDFTGSVAIYSGATGHQLMKQVGPSLGSRFGTALAAVDVDGDGTPELAVAAPGHELVLNAFDDNGLVWIIDALDGTVRIEIEGPPGGGSLGSGVGVLGGAARPTLLVGVPDHPEGARVQAVADLQHVHGAPGLSVFGALISDSPWAVRVTKGAPALPVAFALGLSQLDAPLFGGTLVPEPTWVFFSQLDLLGRLTFQGTWPTGVEALPPLFLQAWIPDPAGPQGWSATQGRRSH